MRRRPRGLGLCSSSPATPNRPCHSRSFSRGSALAPLQPGLGSALPVRVAPFCLLSPCHRLPLVPDSLGTGASHGPRPARYSPVCAALKQDKSLSSKAGRPSDCPESLLGSLIPCQAPEINCLGLGNRLGPACWLPALPEHTLGYRA